VLQSLLSGLGEAPGAAQVGPTDLNEEGRAMLQGLLGMLQNGPLPQIPAAEVPAAQPISWEALNSPEAAPVVPPQRGVGPQRATGRRRRIIDTAPMDPAHVPPPVGAGPTALEQDVDLAHSVHQMPALDPTDVFGNSLREETRTRPLGHLKMPDPLPFQELLKSSLQPIHHVPATLQSEFANLLAQAIVRYCTAPTKIHLFALLALPKLTLRPPKVQG